MKNLALKVCRFVNNSYICGAKKYISSYDSFRSYFERTLRHINEQSAICVSWRKIKGTLFLFAQILTFKCS